MMHLYMNLDYTDHNGYTERCLDTNQIFFYSPLLYKHDQITPLVYKLYITEVELSFSVVIYTVSCDARRILYSDTFHKFYNSTQPFTRHFISYYYCRRRRQIGTFSVRVRSIFHVNKFAVKQ